METLDPSEETVSAVDSLVTYAVEQVCAFNILIFLEEFRKCDAFAKITES